jgi:hypothetical protein
VVQRLELSASSAYHHSKSGGNMQCDSPISLRAIDWDVDVSYSILALQSRCVFSMYACILA